MKHFIKWQAIVAWIALTIFNGVLGTFVNGDSVGLLLAYLGWVAGSASLLALYFNRNNWWG